MDISTENSTYKKRSKRSVLMQKNKEVMQLESWFDRFGFESVKPVKDIPAEKQTPAVCWVALEGFSGYYNIFGLANPTNTMLDYAKTRLSNVEKEQDKLKSVDYLNNDDLLKDIACDVKPAMMKYAKQSIIEKIKDVEYIEDFEFYNKQLELTEFSSCKLNVTKEEAVASISDYIQSSEWEELYPILISLPEEEMLEIANSSKFLNSINSYSLKRFIDDYSNGDELLKEICSWFSLESWEVLLQKDDGGLFLSFVPEDKMSYRFCLQAVSIKSDEVMRKKYVKSLKYVPDIYFTEELCEIAVKANPKSIKYIANPTERMCQDAVERDPEAIKYIENPSEATCIQAVSNNGEMIKYITNLTNKICKAALEAEQGKKYIIINYINDTFKNVLK